MKNKKRVKMSILFLVSLILAISLLTCLPSMAEAEIDYWTAHATAPDLSGTTYTIDQESELAWVAAQAGAGNTFAGKTIKLARNMDLSAHEWSPIGLFTASSGTKKPFSGTFDGDGKTISNLRIGAAGGADTTFDTAGLFGLTDAATITNVGLVDAAIYSNKENAYVGGLVATSYNEPPEGELPKPTVLTNCYVTNTGTSINGGVSAEVGGLIGEANPATLNNCHTAVTVTGGQNSKIGGLVGKADRGTIIESSYATGSNGCGDGNNGNSACAGGLVGIIYAGTSVTDSYATGSVTCGNDVYADVQNNYACAGGLIASSDSSTITNSYATGNVTCGSGKYVTGRDEGAFAGGLVAWMVSSTITNSYAAGNATGGSGAKAGGFLGRFSSSTVSFGYWNNSTATGIGVSEGTNNGTPTGKSSADMQTGSFRDDLNTRKGTNAEWRIVAGKNNGYPVLNGVGDGIVPAPTITSINPNSGPVTGGTSVTITGNNFSAPASVTIGGAAATEVAVTSSTTITAQTPPGTVGSQNVLVTCSGGSSTETVTFTYIAVPEIDVQGNGISIPDGDTTPNQEDYTHFGYVEVSEATVIRTFTIKNTGTADLILSGTPKVTITGEDAAYFYVNEQPNSPIAAAGETTFQVVFGCSTAGIKNATISINNDDSNENPYDFAVTGIGVTPEINLLGKGTTIVNNDDTPSTDDDTDFGSADIVSGSVEKTFTIQNTGTSGLVLNGIPPVFLGGDNPTDFLVTAQPASSIQVSLDTTFKVTFNPSTVGDKTARVSIINNDKDENPYVFYIKGTGTVAPEMGVLGNGVAIADDDDTPCLDDYTDFGGVAAAEGTIERTFTIQNTGTGDLTLTGDPKVAISGANAADFMVILEPAAAVAAGETTTFTVRFNPDVIGVRTAAISIDNNDSDENPYNFFIQGTGEIGPEMEVSSNGHSITNGDNTPAEEDNTDFGSVVVPSSVGKTFSITNSGSVDLLLPGSTPVTVSGPEAADFIIDTQPAVTLAPGTSTDFTITYRPTVQRISTALVQIANNDSNENPYTFTITGMGTGAQDLAVSEPQVTGELTPGGSITVNTAVTNLGTGPSVKCLLQVIMETDSGTVQIGKAISISKLNLNKSKKIKIRTKLPLSDLSVRDYTLRAELILPEGLLEPNSDNNTASAKINIRLPELSISSITPNGTISLKKTNVEVGIENTSPIVAKKFKVTLYLSDSSTSYDKGDIVLGYKKVSKLAGSATLKIGAKLPKGFVFDPATTYYLWAVIDSDQTILEEDEANNSQFLKITQTPADI
ncbi:MAG: choice-of-anchor D domain-containing protein [Chitinophagales bacterium]